MAEKVASLYAEVTAETKDAEQNLKGFKGSLDEAGGGATGMAGMVTSAAGMIGIAIAAITATALTMKQVFDFGAEGAQILQIRSVFEMLMGSVEAAPGILQQIQAATQGTVNELELMANTNKLLTGTEGDLQKALADNVPQLWAIANAASDMNPQLGTAAEMFAKITAAIQSGRATSLAQIGIAVKTSEVYGEYGAAVDKTGAALSKEQQQQALLNAVLEKGATVVAQAAGVNDQAADSIDRMNVALTDAGNSVKAVFAPGIAQAANSVTILLTSTEKINAALAQHNADVSKTAGSYQEYISEMKRAAAAAGQTVISSDAQRIALGNTRAMVGPLASSFQVLSAAEFDTLQSAEGITNAHQAMQPAMDAAKTGAEGLAEALPKVKAMQAAEEIRSAAAAAHALAVGQLAAAVASDALAAGLQGTIQEAMGSYSESMAGLVASQTNLTTQLEDALNRGWSPTSTKVMELNAQLTENQTQQAAAAAAMQAATAQMIYQQAAAGLDGQAALELARAMGVLSEQDYAVSTVIGALKTEFDANADSMISAAEGAGQYAASVEAMAKAVASLQAKGTPVTIDNIAKEMKALETTAAGGSTVDTVKAIAGAAPGLTEFAAGMVGLGESALPALENTNKAVDSIAKVPGVANPAATSVEGMVRPMDRAAKSASELAAAISKIKPVHVSVTINASSFESAITWIGKLRDAIIQLPAKKEINITVNAASGTGAPPPSPQPKKPPGAGGSMIVTPPTAEAQVETGAPINITNNIYNTLAAAILVQQQQDLLQRRIGAR